MILRAPLREVVQAAGADPEAATEALRARMDATPWYVDAMIGVGAWVSGILLLVAAGIAGFLSTDVYVVIGLAALGVAVFLRRTGDGVFRAQIALSLSVGGHAMVIGYVGAEVDAETSAALVALGLGLAGLWAMPDAVHRFASTLLAVGAVVWLLASNTESLRVAEALAIVFGALATAWYHFEARLVERIRLMHAPVGAALLVSFGGLLLPATIDRHQSLGYAAVVGVGLTLLALQAAVFRELGRSPSSPAALATYGLTVALGVATASVPGVLGGLLLMGLALHRRHPVLFGLAAVFFVWYLGVFYYHLSMTLLAKSIALGLAGGLLLGARVALHRSAR